MHIFESGIHKVMKCLKFLPVVLIFLFLSSCTRVVKETYPDGTVKSEVLMRNGVKNGEAKYYFPTGMIELRVNYSDDKLDGPYEKFNAKGIRTELTNYSNGKKEGESKAFSDDGWLYMAANFSNDTINGVYHEYHENGQVKVSGAYNHGLYDGKWEYFDAGGVKVGYADFKNGTGKQVALHFGSKRIKTEVNYVNNEKNGPEIWYDQDGNVEKTIVYSKGKIVSTK